MKTGDVVPFTSPTSTETLYLVADEATARSCGRPRGLVYTVAEVAHLKAANLSKPDLAKVVQAKQFFAGVMIVGQGAKLRPPTAAESAADADDQMDNAGPPPQDALFPGIAPADGTRRGGWRP